MAEGLRPRFCAELNGNLGKLIFGHLRQPLTLALAAGVCKAWRSLIEGHPFSVGVLYPVTLNTASRNTQVSFDAFSRYIRTEPDEHMDCLRLWMPRLPRVLSHEEQFDIVEVAIAYDKPTALAMLQAHSTRSPQHTPREAFDIALRTLSLRVIAKVLMPAFVMAGQRQIPFWRCFATGSIQAFRWFCTEFSPPAADSRNISFGVVPPDLDEKIVLLHQRMQSWPVHWWKQWFYATAGIKVEEQRTSINRIKKKMCYSPTIQLAFCPDVAVAIVKHVLKAVPEDAFLFMSQASVYGASNRQNLLLLQRLAPWCPSKESVASRLLATPVSEVWLPEDDILPARMDNIIGKRPREEEVVDDLAPLPGDGDDIHYYHAGNEGPRGLRRPRLDLQ